MPVMTQTHMTDLGQAYPSVVRVADGSPGLKIMVNPM